jgi:hypothetical protein
VSPESEAAGEGSAAALRAALADRFREITYLTLLLREREGREDLQAQEIQWLTQVLLALLVTPRWWAALPLSVRRRRIRKLLNAMKLFDGDEYLRRNPDVAATGGDPLRHYLEHGVVEGRSRSD